MCKGYLSHPRKHACAKELKNLSVKKNLGKSFMSSFNI